MTSLKLIHYLLPFIFFISCSPKIYLVDRQTILEEEAAGEWPDFEKDLIEKSKAQGPTPFTKIDNSSKRDRLYHVLNGELTIQRSNTISSQSR